MTAQSELPPVEAGGTGSGAEVDLAEDSVIAVGNLEIRPSEGFALVDGRPLRLSVREFGLLAELARNQGRVVSREVLYKSVWGSNLRVGDRTIDVYVRRLRVKLAAQVPEWMFIHTHIGFGYRLQPELAEQPRH
ncbi:MAG: winged helix-turn-helix domain-containing protein [Solirubrobacterales bacterium]